MPISKSRDEEVVLHVRRVLELIDEYEGICRAQRAKDVRVGAKEKLGQTIKATPKN